MKLKEEKVMRLVGAFASEHWNETFPRESFRRRDARKFAGGREEVPRSCQNIGALAWAYFARPPSYLGGTKSAFVR